MLSDEGLRIRLVTGGVGYIDWWGGCGNSSPLEGGAMLCNVEQRPLLKDLYLHCIERNGVHFTAISTVGVVRSGAGMLIEAVINVVVEEVLSDTPWMIRDMNLSSDRVWL